MPFTIVEIDPELGIALDLDTEIPPFALLQARRLIEPEAASLAAKHGSDEQIEGIHEAFLRNQARQPQRLAHASGRPAVSYPHR